MSRFGVSYSAVASGDILSGVIEVQGAKSIGLLVSIPTSCSVYLRGSYDVTSLNSRKISKVDGSGDWTWAVGSGSKAIDLKDSGAAFPYLRIETGVAQGGVASLAIVMKY